MTPRLFKFQGHWACVRRVPGGSDYSAWTTGESAWDAYFNFVAVYGE